MNFVNFQSIFKKIANKKKIGSKLDNIFIIYKFKEIVKNKLNIDLDINDIYIKNKVLYTKNIKPTIKSKIYLNKYILLENMNNISSNIKNIKL